MSMRSYRFLGLMAVAALAAACEGGPAAPAAPELEPELAMEQMAAEATRGGDADNASAFSSAALALRLGIRPSEIEVKIQNEHVIYKALVVGVVRTARDGRVLVRHLIAWTGNRRPSAILQVSSRSDQALFGPPSGQNDLADSPGRARGSWADLVNHQRWIATAGSADMALAGTGGPCPIQPVTDPPRTCVLASYDIRINGNFELLSRGGQPGGGEHLEIHTNADGVNGVVIAPAGN
jgi:hypothetical protein